MLHSSSGSLKLRTLRAGGWSFAGYGLTQLIRLVSTLIMTRLLVPEMFGIMAIAVMISVIINLFSDIGLRENIVQSQRGDDPIFLDTAWVLQILRGLICWLLAVLASTAIYFINEASLFPVQSAYASRELPIVIIVSSLSAVILGFESTNIAIAYRTLSQKKVIQIELVGQVVALIVMISIGLLNPSIWALVIAGLVESIIKTLLSHTWMEGPPNRLRWDKNSITELVHFGKWIAASSIFHVFATTGDRILLGFFVNVEVLGFYSIATQIVSAIQAGPAKLFSTVTLPAFSEIARSEPLRLREIYYRMRIPIDTVLLFLMAFVFASGQFLIDFLYDYRYASAGEILQVLALSLFVVRYGIASQIYLAVGLPRYVMITSAARAISLYTLVPSLYYLIGSQAAIWGIALHGIAMLPFIYYFNEKLNVNNIRKELWLLIIIPLGYAFGITINSLLN